MAIKQTGGTRLTGLNPLAYTGTEPTSPPQLVRFDRAPNNRDFGFNIGDLWLVSSPVELWVLLSKPQNVAFWGLVYPQAGGGGISLIHTDVGDVIADINDSISILGGENINVDTGGPNTVVVNLNRTIQWPTTNSAATEGIIFLAGDRFLHNFGDGGQNDFNTFLGINSGNFTLSASARENTGIGSFALVNVTHGDSNTALGADALGSLTIGIGNIAIGTSAGNNVIAGNDNILIGNQGTIGDADNSVIRIGTETVQTETFVAGIFGSTVAGTVTPKTILNVDDQGQIGEVLLTSVGSTITITQLSNGIINLEGSDGNFSQPFLGIQQIDTPGVTGTGETYLLGSQAPIVEIYDIGNNFNPGDGLGIASSFTAPTTGQYTFKISVFFSTGAEGIPSQLIGLNINGTPYYRGSIKYGNPQGAGQEGFTEIYDVPLTAADVVTFFVAQSRGAFGTAIVASISSISFGTISRITKISGYRIG